MSKNGIVMFKGEIDLCNRRKVGEMTKGFLAGFGIPNLGMMIDLLMFVLQTFIWATRLPCPEQKILLHGKGSL